MYIGREFSLR